MTESMLKKRICTFRLFPLNVFLKKFLYVLIFLRVKVLKQIFCTLHGNDGENNLVSLA